MLNYLISMLALAGLCALWVLFQMWLRKHDPKKSGNLFENRCGSCSSGSCSKTGSSKRPSASCD